MMTFVLSHIARISGDSWTDDGKCRSPSLNSMTDTQTATALAPRRYLQNSDIDGSLLLRRSLCSSSDICMKVAISSYVLWRWSCREQACQIELRMVTHGGTDSPVDNASRMDSPMTVKFWTILFNGILADPGD